MSSFYWKLLVKSRFNLKVFFYSVRINALENLYLEMASHDYFEAANLVRSYIATEPKP